MKDKNSLYNPEVEKIMEACNERKTNLQGLLEEKTFIFQDKIFDHNEELIVALTQSYARKYYWHMTTCPIKTLYLGIITPNTKFNINYPDHSDFLTEIENSYYIELNKIGKPEFKRETGNKFCNQDIDSLKMLYFMNEPPVKIR